MASPHRVGRVRELLRRELSDIVQHLKDPRIHLVTVVDVVVSQDLSLAKMFVSVVGSKEEQQETLRALQSAQGFIRREVAKRVELRYAPEIVVVYDDTTERAARVGALINSLNVPADGG